MLGGLTMFKIGKIELSQNKLIAAVASLAAVCALIIYFVLFAPLLNKLGRKYTECRAIESEVLEARHIIRSGGALYGDRVLMTEKDVSHAIDELTKHGRRKDINFVSISPKKIRQKEGTQYKILPVEMEIVSSYEKLASFLGSLDELEKGLVKVKSFEITPDAKDEKKFATDLVVDIYISGRDNQPGKG